MSKIILGLVGPIASGKEISKKYLEKKYQGQSFRFSTALRDILNRLYLPISRPNLQDLSLSLRTSFGANLLAQVINQDIINSKQNLIIVDGLRRLDDIAILKNLPNFYLIAIDAQQKIRYQRVIGREENIGDKDKTWKQFLEDEQKEAELEIPTVIAQAKYKLDNNGSLDELYEQIDKIIVKIKK
jgi:dephospho-CoA kinase